MNPAGTEGTGLWDGSESLFPAKMSNLLDKSNTEGWWESGEIASGSAHSSAHGTVIATGTA